MQNGVVFAQSDNFEGGPSSAFLHSHKVQDSANGDQSDASPSKALFIGAIKHTGEPVARISAQSLVEKLALASLLRLALARIEEDLGAAIPLAKVQDQASSIRRAA
jgi:hypothetical protein